MTHATMLRDTPRSLSVDDVFVGDPGLTARSSPGWRRAWLDQPMSGVSGGMAAFRSSVVAQCLDTVAVLRAYREPQVGEHWQTPAASERRLLAQVNVMLGLGHAALAQVAAAAIDPDLPDPGRVFASVFVLGCARDPAWLKRTFAIVRAAVLRHPQESAAAVEAMCLAPHAGIEEALASGLTDPDPAWRAVCVRVLGYRGALTQSEWGRAMSEDAPAVVAAALNAPVHGFEPSFCEPLLLEAAHACHEPLVRGALRAGVSLRLSSLHGQAMRLGSGNPRWADALYTAALFGRLQDAELLLAMMAGGEDRWTAVRAAGPLGATALVPALLELLDSADRTAEESALLQQALHRITGLTASGPAGESTLPPAWSLRQQWERCQSRFLADRRYREGGPLNAAGLIERLQALTPASPACPSRSTRRDLYLELVAASPKALPRFFPEDFVGSQRESLARIASSVHASTH